jgi:hypothetical protein
MRMFSANILPGYVIDPKTARRDEWKVFFELHHRKISPRVFNPRQFHHPHPPNPDFYRRNELFLEHYPPLVVDNSGPAMVSPGSIFT